MKIVAEPPVYMDLRMTIPVREALERAGNYITSLGVGDFGFPVFDVELCGIVPPGIVEVCIGEGATQHWGLRLVSEPPYPDEWPPEEVQRDYGAWVPCPHEGCGRALVWFEAGYVPGYRLCTQGHHAQLSEDWRSAKAVRR
jgi:hypothetical protein